MRTFFRLEQASAQHFTEYLDRTTARQAIYLSGIANGHDLSVHLRARAAVASPLCRPLVGASCYLLNQAQLLSANRLVPLGAENQLRVYSRQ